MGGALVSPPVDVTKQPDKNNLEAKEFTLAHNSMYSSS